MIKLLEELFRGPADDPLPKASALAPPGTLPEPEVVKEWASASANYEVARIQEAFKDDRDQLPLPGMRDVSVELAALDFLYREARMYRAHIDTLVPFGRPSNAPRQAYDRLRQFIMEHV